MCAHTGQADGFGTYVCAFTTSRLPSTFEKAFVSTTPGSSIPAAGTRPHSRPFVQVARIRAPLLKIMVRAKLKWSSCGA